MLRININMSQKFLVITVPKLITAERVTERIILIIISISPDLSMVR